MSNHKIAEALKQIGNGYLTLGEALALAETQPTPPAEQPAEPKTRRGKKAEQAEAASPAETTKTAAPDKALPSLEDIRNALIEFANPEKTPGGSMEKAKALLQNFGVGKLPELKAEHYSAFLDAIKAASTSAEESIL